MNEQTLNNLEQQVSQEQLEAKGFRHHRGVMLKVWRDYEIRYVLLGEGLYSFDRMIHLRSKYIGEE